MTRRVGGGEIAVQAYLDHNRVLLQLGDGTIDTADVDFQHRLEPLGRHELLWGAGLRYVRSELVGAGALLQADPESRRLHIASAFVQDEITLEPLRWKLTLGAKAEDSSLSGFEFQPNVRLMWTPTAVDSVWSGWSRAARTPSIGETDARIVIGVQPLPPGSPIPAVSLVNRPQPGYQMRAERLDAVELGYRRNLGNGSFEAVAFVDDYKRLAGAVTDPGGPVFPGSIALPFPPYSLPDVYIDRANPMSGRGKGIELGLDVPLAPAVRLQAAYTWTRVALGHYDDPATAATAKSIEDSSPRHSANARLVTTLAPGHEFDVAVRYVSAVQSGVVPAYTAVDLRYSWKVNRNFELAIIGQNLFDPSHLEFVTDFFPAKPTYQPRRAFIQGIVRF
jgi:iron complex outermembrane receptor protein